MTETDGLTPQKQIFFHALNGVVGYRLPQQTQIQFNQLYLNFRDDRPLLRRLTPAGGSRKDWLTPFRQSIWEVEAGLGAAHYHLDNLRQLEMQIEKLANEHLPKLGMPKGQTIGGGDPSKLNYEYHAFHFALWRTLEYLAVSTATFFKCRAHRIRGLQKSIYGAEPQQIRDNVVQRLERAEADLPEIAQGYDWSVRDILAHHRNVPAGSINFIHTYDGYRVQIFGGGENLDGRSQAQHRKLNGDVLVVLTLSPALETKLNIVKHLALGIYWDFGLLEYPKSGGKSVNAWLALRRS